MPPLFGKRLRGEWEVHVDPRITTPVLEDGLIRLHCGGYLLFNNYYCSFLSCTPAGVSIMFWIITLALG